MTPRRRLVSSLGALCLGVIVVALVATVAAERPDPAPSVPASPANGFPLRFEPAERGGRVSYSADALGGRVSLDGAALSMTGGGNAESWRLVLEGVTTKANTEVDQPSLGPTRVATGADIAAPSLQVPAFRSLRVAAAYPGIDLSAAGTTDRVQLKLAIAPEADPTLLAFRIEGASAHVEGDGSVRWTTPAGDFALLPPAAWQDPGEIRVPLAASYRMTAAGTIAIALPGRAAGRPSEIELSVRVLRSSASSVETSRGMHVALDAAGEAYVAGSVPARSGEPADGGDAFVAKLDRTGSDFLWVTYLDGPAADRAEALAIDPSGRIAVAGRSGDDAFVAELSADGAPAWMRVLRGSGTDHARAVTFDATGRIWVAGTTTSLNLPVTANAAQPVAQGRGDGFVATLEAGGVPAYLSYFGGTDTDEATSLAAAPGGGMVLAGGTRSAGLGTPGTPQSGHSGGRDAFLATLAADGSIVRVTYVGGAGDETLAGIGFDRNGRLVAAGSIEGSFEIPALRTVGATGGRDAFVATIAPDGSRFELATIIGGPGMDEVSSLAVDRAGHILLTGRTSGDFPTFGDARRSIPRGGIDGFVATLDLDGRSLLHAGLIGGEATDTPSSLAVDGNGKVWLAGATLSRDLDDARISNTLEGGASGFVATIDDRPAPEAPAGSCPGTRSFDGGPTGTGTAWQTAANWAGDTLPVAGDDVCIDGFTVILTSGAVNIGTLRVQGSSSLTLDGGTLTIAGASEVVAPATLSIAGATLAGAGNLVVATQLVWSSGTMSGTGTTTANGGIAFGGGSTILTRTLINASGSTATFTGPAFTLTINSPGIFSNQAGATFDQQCDATIAGTGPFNNAGTFLRTTSTDAATISTPFNNTGTVDVQSGTLRLGDTGAHTGDFDSTGGNLEFFAGTQTFSATSDITGTNVSFQGVAATLSGTYNVTGETEITLGTVNFTGATLNLIDIGSSLIVSGGTATLSSGEVLTPDTFGFTGGTIGGSDSITVGGLLTWESGTMGGTGTTTANGGIAFGGGSQTLTRTLNHTSGSTATFTGPAFTLTITTPGIFNNQAGATFDQQCDATIAGTGPFNNAGTFLRTTSTDVATISAPFHNTGTVDVQSGTLRIGDNGTHTGDFDSTGAILQFSGGTHTFSATSDFTGTEVGFTGATATLSGSYDLTGTTRITGGTVNFTGPTLNLIDMGSTLEITNGTATFSSGEAVTPTTLNLSGGTLTGSDAVIVNGLFVWEGGTMSGSGVTTARGGIAFGISSQLLTRRLENANNGTATMSSPSANFQIDTPGVFRNEAGSVFDFQSNQQIYGTGLFDNAGTFDRTNSSGIAYVTVDMMNSGTVQTFTGTLNFAGADNYTQTAGVTRLIGGDVATSGNLTIAGGILTGAGTITGPVVNTGGSVAPGQSPGSLTIDAGTYTQGAGGAYAVEIGGLTAETQHDQLNLTGTFGQGETNLNGTLNGTLVNGFVPAVGDTFTILNATAVNGTFPTLNLPALPGGNVWVVTYTATTVVLNVAPPTNADLAVTNTDAPDPLNAGADVTYTIAVHNNGPDPATNVSLSDPLPASTAFVSATPSQGSCSHAAGTVTCPLGGIANGATATVTIVVTTSGASVPSIGNTATASATEADLTAGNNSATATTTVNPVVNLSITKTDTPDPIQAGGAVTYTVGVTNHGPNDATSVEVIDVLPAGTAFVSATGIGWACDQLSGTITCTRAALAVGTAPDITIGADAPGTPGSITNNVSVTAAEFDPVLPNTASAVTNVTAVADLTITKGDSPDPVDAGATLTYTLDVTNVGPSTANTVSVVDTLPAGVAFVSATGTGWTCGDVAGTVTCTQATLAVGPAPAIAITVTAPAEGGSITNDATVSAAEFDPTTPNTASATTTVTPVADLSIAKTDSPDPANTSSPLTYTVTVTNAGPSTANNLTMTDTLPAGVAFVSATGTDWTCGEASGTVTCTRASLVVGAAPEISIVVTTSAIPGLITNTADIAATEADHNLADNSVSATTSVAVITADLSITKTGSPDPVDAGASLTYTINVANAGPDSSGTITVSDTLPAGVAFVSAIGTGWTCGHAAGTVTCTRPPLAVTAAPAISIVVMVPAEGGSLSNTATVSAPEADNDTANNSATAVTPITPVAELTIVKTDSPDPVVAGEALTYTITVSNAGPSTATNLSVSDELPAGVGFVSAAGTDWTCNNVSGTVTCTSASLGVGTAPAITIDVTAPAAPGLISNTATVTAAESDPNTPNTSTATTNVTGVSDLTIGKGDSPDPVDAGATLTYTLDVGNAGPSPASTVAVVDTLPAGVAFVSATGAGWTCDHVSGTVTCTRATLAVGAAPTITITVTAPAAGGSITNNATASAAEFDPTTPNTTSATTTVTPLANLSITKTDGPDPVNTSSALTYTVTVGNSGPSTADNLTVTDALPAGLAFVSASGSGWTCVEVSGTVTCTRPSLAVGPAPPISIVVTTGATSGAITNTATVGAASPVDPVPANNTSSATTSITSVAELSIVKSDSVDPVNAGGTLAYTLAVTNNGPGPAADVAVFDTLPAGLSFVSATGIGWNCGFASGMVTCSRATLAAGAAPAISVTVTVPAGGTISNTASVSTESIDPVSGNNSDTETTTITPVNDVSIVKTASAPTVAATSTFSYTLTVSNAGPSTTGNVTVTDPLPSGAVYQSASGTGWTCSQASGTVTCTRSNLGLGAAQPITITVLAPSSVATLTNTATVATPNDPAAGNNSSTAVVTVTAAADLRVTKTASASTIADGSNVTYTISVRNAGPATASNVVVTDDLPGDATLVSAGGTGWTCGHVSGTVTCTRPTIGITTAPAIQVTVNIATGGKAGTVCNSASADSAESDPVAGNDTGQVCVEVVQGGGACSSLDDLLELVDDGDIAATQQLQMERFLQSTLTASNAGQRSTVVQRLSLFTSQVKAAVARGAMDSTTAELLTSCATALRQQYSAGGGKRAVRR